MTSKHKPLLYVVAAAFFVMGGCYVLAAMDVVFQNRLTDSVGGAWFQGLGSWALAVGALVWASRLK